MLQGRSDQTEQITFELRSAGGTQAIKTYQVTTDSRGSFTLINLETGTYDLTAKSFNTLRAIQRSISVVNGQTTPNVNFNLLGGDCDGNNVITGLDFSILRGAYGSKSGDSNCDARAYIDGNGVVTGLDFSILRGNYGKAGAN